MVNNYLNQEPISSDEFIAQMSSVKIRCKNTFELQRIFYENYKIIIPIIKWENSTLLRFSIQAYNSMEDIENKSKIPSNKIKITKYKPLSF